MSRLSQCRTNRYTKTHMGRYTFRDMYLWVGTATLRQRYTDMYIYTPLSIYISSTDLFTAKKTCRTFCRKCCDNCDKEY